MPANSVRCGVPIVSVLLSGKFVPLSPTTMGVQEISHHTKFGIFYKISFKKLGEESPNLEVNKVYSVQIMFPPDAHGFQKVIVKDMKLLKRNLVNTSDSCEVLKLTFQAITPE